MTQNAYKALRRDNARRYAALPAADQAELDTATAAIRQASWNLYEIERVRQDLLAMAEQAASEGKTLAKILGPDRASVYDAMAREMEPGDLADWLCTLARPFLLSHAALVALQTLFGTAGRQTLLLFAALLLVLPLGFLLKLAQRRIWCSAAPRGLRRALGEGLCMAVIVGLIALLVLLAGRTAPLPRLSGLVFAAAEVLLYLGCAWLCRHRYNKAAARRPWHV